MRVKSDRHVSHVLYGVYVLFSSRWYRVGPWSESVHEAEARMAELCSLHRGLCFQLRDTDQNVVNAFGTPQTGNVAQPLPVA